MSYDNVPQFGNKYNKVIRPRDTYSQKTKGFGGIRRNVAANGVRNMREFALYAKIQNKNADQSY